MTNAGVGNKVRAMIDDHVISVGIDPRIPPVSITAADFERQVDGQASPRAKASEMEHALRYHIRRHVDEDPVHYQKLSERLEEILHRLEADWDQLTLELRDLVHEAQAGRQRDETGLDPETQAPFFDLLVAESGAGDDLTEERRTRLCEYSVELVAHIKQEVLLVGFWGNPHAQEVLRNWTFQFLDEHDLVPDFDVLGAVTNKVVELAKAIHHKLVR